MKKILLINFLIFVVIVLVLEVGVRSLNLINLLGVKKNLFTLNQSTPSHNTNVESIVYGKKVYTDKFGFRVPMPNYSYRENKTNFFEDRVSNYSKAGVCGKEEDKEFDLEADF